MSTFDEAVERAARAGYEAMLQASDMFINKHPWEKEPAELRQDWIKTAVAVLKAYGCLLMEGVEEDS